MVATHCTHWVRRILGDWHCFTLSLTSRHNHRHLTDITYLHGRNVADKRCSNLHRHVDHACCRQTLLLQTVTGPIPHASLLDRDACCVLAWAGPAPGTVANCMSAGSCKHHATGVRLPFVTRHVLHRHLHQARAQTHHRCMCAHDAVTTSNIAKAGVSYQSHFHGVRWFTAAQALKVLCHCSNVLHASTCCWYCRRLECALYTVIL